MGKRVEEVEIGRNEQSHVQKSSLAARISRNEYGTWRMIKEFEGHGMACPWDGWAPGVLNRDQMAELFSRGYITSSAGVSPKIGHSSMDLTLANEAYEMLKGSVKPGVSPYDWFISQSTKLAKRHDPLADGNYLLSRQMTYIFRLQEKLGAGLRKAGVIHGQATAKSSVGRIDVLARLIVDGMRTYESFDPQGLEDGTGEMYLEITPITFDVLVKPGTSLSQLRLFYGRPEDVIVRSKELYNTIFRMPDHQNESLTVNLSDAVVGNLSGTTCKGVTFRSKPHKEGLSPVPLWDSSSKPNPCGYWDVGIADELERLYIEPDRFYILRSKEKLHVPKGIAIYCRANDETMGEMRIHYAGFVHPYFGLYREDGKQGTPLIFEVRGHQVPVSLANEEKMANLIFYRMSEDAPPLNEEEKKKEAKGYGSQDLKLSNFFGEWPEHITRNDDGSVSEIRKGGDHGTN